MNLLDYRDPALREKAQRFDFQDQPFDPIEFSQELVKFMYEKNAICITAPQVGVPYQIFAMRGSPENFVCFNPRVVMHSQEEIRLKEISLTYPGLCVKIKRSQHCRVRFSTPNGETRTETYTGLTARTFLHNMDFLNGEVFYHKANPIHRQQALKKWKNGKYEYLLHQPRPRGSGAMDGGQARRQDDLGISAAALYGSQST